MLEYFDALTILRVPGAECFIQRPLHFPNAIKGLNFVCAGVTADFNVPHCPIYEDVELLTVGSWNRRDIHIRDRPSTAPRWLHSGMIIPRFQPMKGSYDYDDTDSAVINTSNVYVRFDDHSRLEEYCRFPSPSSNADYVPKLLRTICGDANDSYSLAELSEIGHVGWHDGPSFAALHLLEAEVLAERLHWPCPFPMRELDYYYSAQTLKQHCRTLGLPVSGNKTTLRTRILAHAFPTYFE